MKLKQSIVIGVFAIAALCPIGVGPAAAGPAFPPNPADQSLRALAMRHGLFIGTAIDMNALADPNDPTYKEIAASQFSTVTAENAMKWENLEPTQGTYNWGPADQLIEFARANHQLVHGHVLAWQNQLPKWLTDGVASGAITDAQLKELLKKYITEVVTHFRGKIWQWDVVNEAVTDPWSYEDKIIRYKGFWYEHLGAGFIADAFRWARAADPYALLLYNDYNIEAFGDGSNQDKTQFVYNMIKDLRAQGVPVDGVGIQGHLSTRYGNYNAQQISDAVKKFSELGIAIAFTEADVRSQISEAIKASGDQLNPRLQASAYNYSAMLQACLSNRHCLSFTVWGFDDKHNWCDKWDFGEGVGAEGIAAIYDENYTPKHAYYALKADLTYASPPYVLPRVPQMPKQ